MLGRADGAVRADGADGAVGAGLADRSVSPKAETELGGFGGALRRRHFFSQENECVSLCMRVDTSNKNTVMSSRGEFVNLS